MRAKFALIGGLAVSARTEARMTRDVDFAIGVENDAEAEQLVYNLQHDGYEVIATVEQIATNRLATARMKPASARDDGAVLDLLFASSGIEPEIVSEAEQATFLRGVKGPLALTGHLIALKVLSRNDQTRPQDAADLRALLQKASSSDIERARRSLQLIESRGYHRDRPLLTLLQEAQTQFIAP
jgi:predicted nucleotidyltransferase